MPYQLPLCILPVAPALHDTVKVYVLKEGFSWDKILAALVGLVAVIVAVIGWKKNQRLTRENNVKGFEEQILDRIRVELNQGLFQYKEWLRDSKQLLWKIYERFISYNSEHSWTSSEFGSKKFSDFNLREVIPKHLSKQLSSLALDPRRSNWSDKFRDYQMFLPKLKRVSMLLNFRDITHQRDIQRIAELRLLPDKNVSIWFNKVHEENEDLSKLRGQFFQVLQYECLKSSNLISKPDLRSGREPDEPGYFITVGLDGNYDIPMERQEGRLNVPTYPPPTRPEEFT